MKDQKQAYLSPETEVVEMVTDGFMLPVASIEDSLENPIVGW